VRRRRRRGLRAVDEGFCACGMAVMELEEGWGGFGESMGLLDNG
jgi:hypothetical protein